MTTRKKKPSTPTPTARTIRLPYPKDENGKPLCRWCRKPVLPPRKSWCGDGCVEEYRTRYDSVYQRKIVLRRDRGRCIECGLDTVLLANEIKLLWKTGKRPEAQALLLRHGFKLSDLRWKARGLIPLWQADHIVPVIEGGGGTGPENLRTLCLPHHRDVTRALMARRKAARLAEKEAQKAAEKAKKAKEPKVPRKPPRPPTKPTKFKWTGVRPKPPKTQ